MPGPVNMIVDVSEQVACQCGRMLLHQSIPGDSWLCAAFDERLDLKEECVEQDVNGGVERRGSMVLERVAGLSDDKPRGASLLLDGTTDHILAPMHQSIPQRFFMDKRMKRLHPDFSFHTTARVRLPDGLGCTLCKGHSRLEGVYLEGRGGPLSTSRIACPL
jgi:hypothetical protein